MTGLNATRRSSTRTHTERVVLEPYFRELEAETLMSPQREARAARAVVAASRGYWGVLVGWSPTRRAVAATLREHGTEARGKGVDWNAIGRTAKTRAPDEQSTAAFIDVCRQVDPDADVADILFADVEALHGGAVRGSALSLRKSQRTAETFEVFTANLRRARLALHAARSEFARANLRLVVTMAHRYRSTGELALADLVQEGNLGLMTAVDRFDPERGFRFSTYATWWIRHAIRRAVADRGRAVRVPLHVLEMRTRLAKARIAFEQEQGRAPTDDELAQLTETPVEKIEGLARVLLESHEPRVDPEFADGVAAVERLSAEDVPPTGRIAAVELSDALERALDVLRPMEAEILRMRFGLDESAPLKLREIGSIYSLSRERIRQLQDRALGKLRDVLAKDGFAESAFADG